MTTTQTHDGILALIAVLDSKRAAKSVVKAEDNPYNGATLADLSHGLMKGADNMPALNMAAKYPKVSTAYDLEAGRIEFANQGHADKSARRMAEAKMRAERKVEFDSIAAATFTPDPDRMEAAWRAVIYLSPIITKIAASKQRWANRLIGSNADDIPQMALEATAMVLAKQAKFDPEVIVVAAEQLGISERGIPGDQTVDEADPDDKKAIRKARKWLMGMVNNRVMGAVVDSYTAQNNLRSDNLDIIATVCATINGIGDDPMVNRHKADRAPSFLGTRFPSPGGIDGNLLAMSITAAITEHGLDALVEFLLDDDHRRVDGAVKWSEHAEAIFNLTPGGLGPWMWDQVVAVTADHEHGRRRRGIAARDHVRNLFAWLPGLIVASVDAFDFQFRSWSTANMGKALLSSDFESYLSPQPDKRLPLRPALHFTTTKEAASMLVEHLARLTTGNELVASAVNA